MLETMKKAIDLAKSRGQIVPRLTFIYMDDCWCLMPHRRPGLRNSAENPSDPAADFNDCLNSVHERVQFTREEEEDRSIAFLDTLVTREENGKLSTKIYRKPSNTNITIKPNSCQHPNTSIATFKGELCRAYRLCSSIEQAKKEIAFTIDLFEDNGHNRKLLESIANTYEPPSQENHNNNRKNNNKGTNKQNHHQETIPSNLFAVLPFWDVDLSEEEKKPYIVIPYLPNGTYHQMKRACNKAGITLVTKPGPKLTNVPCGCNKTRHDPSIKPGIYKISCSCSSNDTYVGQTICPIATRGKEHKRAAETGNWHHSGIAQHKENCKEDLEWEPDVIVNMTDKNQKRLTYNLKVREALEIRRHNSGPGQGLNEDYGAYVKTTAWNPVFNQMGDS